ncbi:ParA family protein [Microscilla marina]|uniref:Plasmid partition protein ParF, putative n=1 Tax=Microscilla marina ATCC 23134 TaxID=313606 RepID=A1ZZU3_MICM2|nr:ParA family protein [Microscilla marina]EAY24104.1 plasmid partition protein ParF, putative [Microscilla marina ATCC 23134]
MAKIISFISRKGGTGKTTNAIQIATMLHSLGYKLALIETDTNYTLSTLRKMELFKSGAKEGSIFDIIGSKDDKVLADIEALHPAKLDYIIIDSAGKTTDNNIKNLAVQSDAVVVPTSLTQNDVLVTYQTVQDLKPAQDINKNLKIIVLPNRVHSRTSPANIHRQLADLKTVITENFVPAKNIYAQFSTILPEKQYQDIARELIGMLQ